MTKEPNTVPHESNSRVPDLRELMRLFPPLSRGRDRLRRAHRILHEYRPAPPSYVAWNLGRYVKTIDHLEDVVRPTDRWLDISSDPWFCLIAKKEIAGEVELVGTGFETTTIDFRNDAGDHYRFSSKELQVSEDQTPFPGGGDFDLVSSFEVIEHLAFHPAPFLAGCSAALRSGGKMVLTTPNVASWSTINRLFDGAKPHMTNHYGGPMDHRKEYTTWEMQRLIEAAGFRIETMITFDGYPNDLQSLRSSMFWVGTLMWHMATLQAVRVRNHLLRGGSTMLIVATKTAPCDIDKVAAVAV